MRATPNYRTWPRLAAVAISILSLLAVALPAIAADPPGVTPASYTDTRNQGVSTTIAKTVQTTAIPPLVDIFLLEDETGSFNDDIANLQTLAAPSGPLVTALNATGANYATGVAGFRDFARDSWGSTGDWLYRRLSNITAGGAGLAGVAALTASGGNDTPEGYLEALHYLATTGHPAIDSNGDGDTTDANDTPTGLQPAWRANAKRVVLLATDASCHVTGDATSVAFPLGWPGDAGTTSPATTAGLLAAQNITVIGLIPSLTSPIACVTALATGTGGTVQATTASGSAIVAAIIAGLSNLPVTVTPSATCDAGLTAVNTPASLTVTSGQTATFSETITAASDATVGSTLHCTVDYLVNGSLPGPAFTQTITITINNHAPTIDITSPTDMQLFGMSGGSVIVPLTSNVSDPDQDSLSCSIDWEGATTASFAATETGDTTTAPTTGTCNTSHAYTLPGVYTITATVTDSAGLTGTDSVTIVVFNPEDGFVTGGGSIDSPAGAYTADPLLTGRASFGFVSRYQKGAVTPTGSTEFQFKAGDLNFHSTSYDWLVIAGSRAMYKGTGTVNGVAGYSFILSAVDGDLPGGGGVDKFRIKIMNAGGVVYDNQIGAADDAPASTAIAGGNIVIHN